MVNEFLNNRHEKFNVSKDMVFNLVKDSTKLNPTKRNKIIEGYDNEVYSIETKEGKHFILRINRKTEAGFENEAWAMEQCKKSGVPLPKIFLLDTIQIDDKKVEVMLQNKLAGLSLEKLQTKLSKQELEQILFQAGDVLSKIHSVKADGFYHRHREGNWDFPSWDKFMQSTINGRSSEREFIFNAGFNDREFNFMINMLKKYKEEFSCDQPVLCHGDYSPEHIFVDNKLKISGIIDFGMIEGNHPIHDFAYLSFQNPQLDLKPIMEGYKNKSHFEDRFNERLNLHKLLLQMGHLAHHSKIKDYEAVKSLTLTLRKTLNFLKTIKK
ncbi:hypothetical protein CL656_04025 [bacterium]|nr:hypothetical protein [bacterium]|tara:strand:- start:1628 stop:2602 length:975 start_codon:yes stop_codon:yes gene_type:complete